MTDRREMILTRLLEIAVGVDGIVAAFRNKDEISEKQRPTIVILDADEVADDFIPSSSISLISDEWGTLELSGECAAVSGSFGTITDLEVV